MQWENLFYALTQFIHNFGALTVVAGAVVGLKYRADTLSPKTQFAWLVLGGWVTQALSGIMFGGISLYFYGETPDLHSTAQVAFIIKLVCAGSGILLSLLYIFRSASWNERARRRSWFALTAFGVTALTAAAFLRWFS